MRRPAVNVTTRRLQEPSDAGLSGPTTAAERITLVETLTLEAWALSGQPLPAYARIDAPVRILPLGIARRPTNR